MAVDRTLFLGALHTVLGTDPESEQVEFSESLFDEFALWGIDGLVAARNISPSNGSLRRKLAGKALAHQQVRSTISQGAESAVEEFASHGIVAVPFKGLATSRYYQDRSQRWFSDADLFVADDSHGDMVAALVALGLPAESSKAIDRLARKGQCHGVTLDWHGACIDLHFVPTGQYFAPRLVRTGPQLGPENDNVPNARGTSAEFDLVLAIVNAAREAGNSVKAAVDAVQILRHHPSLDWSVIDEITAREAMQHVVRPMIGTVARDLAIDLSDRVPGGLAEPLPGMNLFELPPIWTPKRGSLLNLYYGPFRPQAALAMVRWVAMSNDQLRAAHPYSEKSSGAMRWEFLRQRAVKVPRKILRRRS